jgi:hypothetical protein
LHFHCCFNNKYTPYFLLFVIMTGFFLPRQSHFSVWFNLILCSIYAINFDYCC